MIFRRLGLLTKLQHLNVPWPTTEHWTRDHSNTALKSSGYLISDFLSPLLLIQCRHFNNSSLLTLLFSMHTLVHFSNNLFHWIIVYFYLTLQCPAFGATLTCLPPIALMLLIDFILSPNPQMLYLTWPIRSVHYCTVCTARSGQRSTSSPVSSHRGDIKYLEQSNYNRYLTLLCYRTPKSVIQLVHFPLKGSSELRCEYRLTWRMPTKTVHQILHKDIADVGA